MLVGIISDTHRNKENMDKATKKIKKCDLVFHLGDNYEDIDYIKGIYKGKIIGVCGNCDTMKKLSKEAIYTIKGHTIFLTHGDCYRVKLNTFNLKYRAMEIGADIVLYGHSHISSIEKDGGILFINPGSVGEPRDRNPSIAIMDINENSIECEIISI